MQLDFLGDSSMPIFSHYQSTLFDIDKDGKVSFKKHRATPKFEKANAFFQSLSADEIARYKTYWASVAPENDSEKFQRYLFAFMSVHSTWESNVKGYQAIKDWTQWFNAPDKLKTLLEGCGVGLYNQRHAFLETFTKHFWTGLKKFNKLSTESWTEYRNRLEQSIDGLGKAKVSFALELMHPLESQAICMDTHLFQLYGLEQKRDKSQYEIIEKHWIEMSKCWNIPPAIARHLWWDKNQSKPDSRYWSYVFEN
jgi:hypothetical protein